MRLSTRTKYGVRALVDLAEAYPDRRLSVKDIAEREKISAKYLEHIMARLKAAGLVDATRGMHGGYMLCDPPERVSLHDVYPVLEGSTAPTECVDEEGECERAPTCPTKETWAEVKEAIDEVLDKTTLADLVKKKQSKTKSARQMYVI